MRPVPFLALAAASALLLPLALPSGSGVAADLVPEVLDLTGAEDLTDVVLPEHLTAPARATGIGPGSRLIITMPGGTYGCTANFVWRDGGTLYLGSAGHCFVPADHSATHGPGATYDPSRTRVRVCVERCDWGGQTGFLIGGTTVELGPVAYARSSQGGERVGNDFGVVQIPAALESLVRPSLPVWGGPTTTVPRANVGERLCFYGAGVAVGESWPTMARAGVAMFMDTSTGRYDANYPSAPGDSGMAVVTCAPDGAGLHGVGAFGINTHTTPIGSGIKAGTTIAKAQQMATQAGLSLQVVLGE